MGRVRVDKSGDVKFHRIPSKRMKTYDLDWTEKFEGDGSTDLMVYKPPPPKDIAGAFVKLRIRYRKGYDESVKGFVKMATEEIAKHAFHVCAPELIAIGTGHTRMPELTPGLDPIGAALVWLKAREKLGWDQVEFIKLLREYLGKCKGEYQRLTPNLNSVDGLELLNFMPFQGTQELKNLGPGVYGVSGLFEGLVGRSNRSGKSALLEAFRYALNGVARKVSIVDKYIHNGQKEMGVKLWFNGDSNVHRKRIRKGQASVLVNDSKPKNVDQVMFDKIGIEDSDFVDTCFVEQGGLHGVLGKTSGKIKTDVMRWLGLDIWKEVEKQVLVELKKVEKDVERAQMNIDLADGDILRLKDAKLSQEEFDLTEFEIVRFQEKIDACKDIERTLKDLDEKIGESRAISKALKIIKEHGTVERKVEVSADGLVAAKQERDEVLEIKGKLNSEKREAEKNLKNFDGICPVDGVGCPRVDDINEDTVNRMHVFTEVSKNHERVCQNYKGANDDVRAKEITHQVLVENFQWLEKAKGVVKNCGDKPEDIDAIMKKRDEIVDGVKDIKEYRNRLDDLRDEMSEMKAMKMRRDDAMARKIKFAVEIKEAAVARDNMRTFAFAVGKKGIPSMQVENALVSIQDNANDVLEELGTEHRLEFSFETYLQKKEAFCPECGFIYTKEKKCPACNIGRDYEKSDELTVNVIDNGNVQSFGQDSGGGKDLLALAVRIGLAKFFGIKVLFLDECCGSLDEENLRLFVDMVSGLPKHGFYQVFVISHRPDVAEALPRNIEVIRNLQEARSVVTWQG